MPEGWVLFLFMAAGIVAGLIHLRGPFKIETPDMRRGARGLPRGHDVRQSADGEGA